MKLAGVVFEFMIYTSVLSYSIGMETLQTYSIKAFRVI